ncbi:MAG: PASTA domain-containing protein, partial [Actinobacteria bacterium]|nr:PASTA domain-containing protein [Actinomycetota bacterium]
QVKGQEVRPASDIFAAGAILYELLVGVNPFEYGIVEPSYTTVIYRVVSEDPVPMAEIDPEMPPELDTIVGRALQKDPADRYTSFRHFLNDLTLVSRMFSEFAYHINRHLISGELLAASAPRTPVKAPRLTLRKKPLEVPKREEPAAIFAPVETGALPEEAPVSAPTEEEVPSSTLPREETAGAPPEEPVVEDLEEEVPQGATLVVKREEVPIEEEPPPLAEPEEVEEELEVEPEETGETAEQREPEPAVAAYEEEAPESPPRGNLKKVLVASVILLVAIGGLLALLMWPTPESKATVPDVVGKAEDEAKWAVEKAGFEFSPEYTPDNSAEAGEVLEQEPKAGKKAVEKSKVAVIVASRGKVDVPNICGMTQDEALGLLGQNRLNYKITQEGNPDQSLHSLILGQNPAAGSTLDAGSEVELFVAVFQGEQPPGEQESENQGQRVRKTRQVACSTCGGSGVISQTYSEQQAVSCPTCGGTGHIADPYVRVCPTCGGSGVITETVTKTRQVTCTTCGGSGYTIEEYWVYE